MNHGTKSHAEVPGIKEGLARSMLMSLDRITLSISSINYNKAEFQPKLQIHCKPLQNLVDFKPQASGTRLAQSMEHVTLDLGVLSSSPTLGVDITQKIKSFKTKQNKTKPTILAFAYDSTRRAELGRSCSSLLHVAS